MATVRPARAGEAASLTALCLRSKAHWGYDAEFMRLSALTLKVHEIDITADPHATPFYERMGARFLRNAPSDAIPGRVLPLYEYDLTAKVEP